MSVSAHGFWLFFKPLARELFLPFRAFPWFKDATIRDLCAIEVQHGHILHWPALDIDLDIERIEHPERYPLIAGKRPGRADPKGKKLRTLSKE